MYLRKYRQQVSSSRNEVSSLKTRFANQRYQAFGSFMQAYQDMVFSTAMRLLANRQQAEDIAQEVFLKAYEHFDGLQDNPGSAGWLKTVATHLSLNHLSRHRRRWRLFSEMVEPGKEQGSSNDELMLAGLAGEDLLDRLHDAQCQQHLEQALQQLPEHQRVPLVLYHFEALSYLEIAERLRVSLSKVKIDILRGRAALARQLARYAFRNTQP